MAHVKSSHELERGIRNKPEFALFLSTIAAEVASVARDLAAPSARSHDLVDSISVGLRGNTWVAKADSEHAAPVEGGTGLYGPSHRMIVAPVGKSFRITQADGSVVAIKKQRGTKPKHIMQHAAETVAARSDGLTYNGHRRWRHVPD